MSHRSHFCYFLKKLLLVSCFIFGASCGTQVGNPTDNDEPPKNSPDDALETHNGSLPKSGVKQTQESASSTSEDRPMKQCFVNLTFQALTPPESTGSLTIVLVPAVDFTASITPPGLNAIEGKMLSMTSTGIYKFTVTPSHGTACSAEISIDSNLVQKIVSATVTLP